MTVLVELIGPPRAKAGARELRVEMPDGGRLGDLVASLAELAPALVGPVIGPQKDRLVEPYVFHLEGGGLINDPEARVGRDARLAILMASVGG